MTRMTGSHRHHHVAVLSGGRSAERAVSLESGANVAKALRRSGHEVREIDIGDKITPLITQLTPKPDIVFNALHGCYGEDGCIQGLLAWMDIPYTHSGVLASALAMNKPVAKTLFREVGIPCPSHRLVKRIDVSHHDPLPRPYVVKPLSEGSSIGVEIVTEDSHITPFDDWKWGENEPVMIEEYIPGRELTVAVLDDEALGVLEIHPPQGFYDFAAKYHTVARHSVPAAIPHALENQALEYALKGHKALGCRGVSRADFRYDTHKDSLFLLEINTQPGMTAHSLLPEIAAWRGIDYDELVERLLSTAQSGP